MRAADLEPNAWYKRLYARATKVQVIEAPVPQAVAFGSTRTRNTGVRVRLPNGREEVIGLRDILSPWSEEDEARYQRGLERDRREAELSERFARLGWTEREDYRTSHSAFVSVSFDKAEEILDLLEQQPDEHDIEVMAEEPGHHLSTRERES